MLPNAKPVAKNLSCENGNEYGDADATASNSQTRIHAGADVSASAQIGSGSSIWHLAQVREGAVLGRQCVVGRGAYVGSGVVIGDHCKLQNYALVYEPAVLEDGVFVGPGAVFTNDHFPRAITPEGALKQAEDWHAVGVTVRHGASIGARAVCVAPVIIGAWALVAAGAVVTRNVPDFALVAGVPAKQRGWVGRAGTRLEDAGPGRWRCPRTGEDYVEVEGVLELAATNFRPPEKCVMNETRTHDTQFN